MMKQQLSFLFTMMCVSLFAQNITLELNTSLKNQMNIIENSAGVYDIETLGGDPWIVTKPITQTYNPESVYVISFDYDAPDGLDNLELRYRDGSTTFNALRKLDIGALPATKSPQSFAILVKLNAIEWNQIYTFFRFDFGISGGQQIQIKNILLRAPTASEVQNIDLNVTGKNQMDIAQNPDGSYNILTTGTDPYVISQPIENDYDHEQLYMLTFQYQAVNEGGSLGIDDVQIFYGTPFTGARSTILGQQEAASNWKTATVNMKFKAPNWTQPYTDFRFDFGRRANLNIKVRNIALRVPTPAEIDATTIESEIPINLNLNSQAQMDAVLNGDGSYTILTLGNDPRITSKILEKLYDYNETFYISFDYIAEEGLDDLTIFYGPPNPTRRVTFGRLEPTSVYKSIAINMKRTDTWNSIFNQFRFDFGASPDQSIRVKNIQLRTPTQEELDNDPIIINQENNAFLNNYFNTNFSSNINSVIVDQQHVTINAHLPENAGDLYLCELKMYNAIFEPENISFSTPLSSEEQIKTIVDRFIIVEDVTYDRIYSRWIIAKKDGNDYTYVSNAQFPNDIYKSIKRYLPEEKPTSIKGIGASAGPQVAQDLSDLGAKNVRTGILYGNLLSLEPTSVEYDFNGKTYYFNPNYVEQLDIRYKNSTDNGLTTSVVLLIPSNAEAEKKAILTHPDADSNAFYSIANVTSAIGVEYYAAITSFLAERYTRPDKLYGRITNWIIHNEVDAASEWTNAGDKPMDVYTELYDRSMRTVYYSIRQFDPSAKVFISLTQFWNAAFDYPPKLMLETMNKLSRTGGDYEWGIAHHPYPQNGNETWNDIQVTNDLNTSPKITPKNIELMDTWMRSKDNLYNGLKVRSLMFTEQGINAGVAYNEETFQQQAAGVAYMWKKFSRLPSLEAVHYHRLVDNSSVFPVYFGLWTRDEASTMPEKRGVRKPSWYVWQAAGTEDETSAFDFALPIINVNSWEETFNPLVGEVNLCDVSFNVSNEDDPIDSLQIYFNGEMHQSENRGKAIFYNAASLSEERTIKYVLNDTLIWPEINVVIQQDEVIFQDLKPVDGLKAVGISPTKIRLSWEDITDFENGFIIERNNEDELNFSIIDSIPANTTFYLDEGLTSGTSYKYRLRAYNDSVKTLSSKEVETKAPFIIVDYKDGDNNRLTNNAIKPLLKLRNEADYAVDLNRLSVRYWFTSEDFAPLNFYVDYAQLGTSDVNGAFVALEKARDGANYYLEMTFDTNKKIAALGNSGEIKTRIAKSNWTNFDEADDHSYSNHNQYLETAMITVYWDGQLIWGEEPEISNEQGAKLVVKHQNKDGVTNNSIKPTLKILNTGNQPVALQDITLRYWLTPESQSELNYNIDYAVINSSYITGAFQTPEVIYEGAERYFEVGFTQNAGTLNAFSQTGEMTFRINKQDWSNFMESDDFSYRSTGNTFEDNLKITGYINGQLVWGEEPSGVSALRAQKPSGVISVYPNPATNTTTLLWYKTIGQVNNLHLVDYMNVSYNVEYNFSGDELAVQFSNLNTGIYMIVGSINGEGFAHRLVVE